MICEFDLRFIFLSYGFVVTGLELGVKSVFSPFFCVSLSIVFPQLN